MLGVITEATLRIIPHPERRAMLTATFPEFVDAAGAVQAVLNAGHLPSALEITDEFTLKAARDYLGREALPEGKAHLIVEIDGRAGAVAGELRELRGVLERCGATSVEEFGDDQGCEAVWQLRRDFSYSLRATGLTKLNEDIVVPRSKLVDLASFAAELQERTGIPVACFGHAGDGNIHTNLMVEDYHDPEIRERADEALDVLFRWVLENGGVITGEHGVGLAKKKWIGQALGDEGMAAHRAVKAAFDPEGILNPGKFLD
jgi:FAD/FMN-containing dehydrogenase